MDANVGKRRSGKVGARAPAPARELHLARVEGQLAQARLHAPTSQIRPHFLFNTLHTIAQIWRSGRSDDADAVLDRLGALFQRVQRTTARTEVPLAEELEMVRDYLAIEEVRFRDRLSVVIEADPPTLDCAVPPLILQPIVENAVRHGISAASSAGSIEIRAGMADGRLCLVVGDDGPGVDALPRPALPRVANRDTADPGVELGSFALRDTSVLSVFSVIDPLARRQPRTASHAPPRAGGAMFLTHTVVGNIVYFLRDRPTLTAVASRGTS